MFQIKVSMSVIIGCASTDQVLMQVSAKYLLERFRFTDTRDNISLKISSSLQACIEDRREEGPSLPVKIEMLQE